MAEISSTIDLDVISSFDEIERHVILYTIQKCKGNAVQAAEMLGMGPATVYRKVKKYGYRPTHLADGVPDAPTLPEPTSNVSTDHPEESAEGTWTHEMVEATLVVQSEPEPAAEFIPDPAVEVTTDDIVSEILAEAAPETAPVETSN